MHRKTHYLLFFLLAIPLCIQAAPNCSSWLATAVSIQGKVDTQGSKSVTWNPIKIGHNFCYGDKIRTSRRSRATLIFNNGPRVTLSQNSTLSFSSSSKNKASWIVNLIKGSGFFRSRQPQRLNVQTPFINAVHQGTEFLVTVTSQQTEITVFDGLVAATNQLGEIHIKKAYTGIATKNKPPHVKALTIRPEDAVQWSLYYPTIINVTSFSKPSFQDSIEAYQQGNPHQALTLLDKTLTSQQDSQYFALKASLLLTLGSVDESLKILNQTLLQQPNNSAAIALQSIIAVSKNRQKKALSLAQKAVSFDPQSATAQIALSYAYQSQFQIPAAMLATQEAVRLSPDNALAWARLAELQLSNGERSNALKSSTKAQILNPSLGRTQTILGFSYLAQIDIDEAKKAFTQAINLDSADPLAHLGLGLAKIRKGYIEEGTRDIETAVSLDPDNATMRSYLGKAYYELRNNDFAATELKIAKEMDPNDPTPWFYDAIRKQSTNRPVEALQDMQKAIELNDNRGVYRSKLLLDEDLAARSANMARIYQDLGFDRVALKQAWTSLAQDFTSPSAHRFLSDSLQGRPRQRIARASELLQAQLFQPINLVPVQPQLTNENIDVLNSTGPGSLSSNEYDSLFTSNGAHILLNGAIGSNNTLTDNAIISGIYNNLSLSFGQFHFQTDGFRKNDDYKQNIYNVFAQLAITPNLNIQVELKKEDVEAGDVPLRFDSFHRENLRQSIDQDTARLGLHYNILPQHDLIFSTVLTQFKEKEKNREFKDSSSIFFPFVGTAKNTSFENQSFNRRESGFQLEGQYLYHPEYFDIILGAGYLNLNSKDITILQEDQFSQFIPFFGLPGPVIPTSLQPVKTTINQKTNIYNGYAYSHFKLSKGLTSTLGLSIDIYNDELINKNQLNPKVGLVWSPINNIVLRGAAFRTLKKPLVANQTIEPTQIAGFNQFFDDQNGSSAWNYGVGVDFQFYNNLYIGGELMWRDTKQPIISTTQVKSQDRNESAHLAYLYWAPLPLVTFSSEYQFSKFQRDYTTNNKDSTNPRSLTTQQVPLSLNFQHSSGLFSKFTGTFVHQNISYVNEFNGLDKNSDYFWTFDTTLGIRLPKRLGSLSIGVNNLFNKSNYKYHSVFDASGPQLTTFVPEREIFFKLNLAY